MDNIDFKLLLIGLISSLRDKAGYLKNIDRSSPSFEQSYFDGMAMAYHQVLDNTKWLLEDAGLNLEDFGMDAFDPLEILSYVKPPKGEKGSGEKGSENISA